MEVRMRLADALSKYRDYSYVLDNRNKELTKKKEEFQKSFELTGEKKYKEEAALLQLNIDANSKEYKDNQKIVQDLIGQYMAIWDEAVAKNQENAVENAGRDYQKIMTTVSRLCAGDKVPPEDERKLMEYDGELYMRAKEAQQMIQKIKKKQKEYDSLWDEDETAGKIKDPKKEADNAEVQVDLPEVSSTQNVMTNSEN